MTTAVATTLRGGLPLSLRDRYGGDLEVPLRTDRPTVIANFVTTLDGVVSYQTPDAMGGGEISGFYEPDRFVMGVLRSLADVVLVGAGTVRAAPKHRWVPAHVNRANAEAFAELRRRLDLAPLPTTAVVTASGDIDLAHPGLSDPDIPVLVLTTDEGAGRIRNLPAGSRVEVISVGDSVSATAVIELLHSRGANLILSEGGPNLIGQLMEARLLDELFLTIAPQIAGRSPAFPRLALVEGVAFTPQTAPWFDLVDVRPIGHHLFTRYHSRGGIDGQA